MNKKGNKILLTDYSLQEMQEYLTSIGESKFRGKQIFNWVYDNYVSSFTEMKNIPNKTLEKLEQNAIIHPLELIEKQQSNSSNTVKYLFQTTEGHKIESVIIPEGNRKTLCLSTQVGCPLDCKFCATGLMGYTRNLSVGEILDQYLLTSSDLFPDKITNIVFMGMGEPLLNYTATEKSLKILLNDLGNKIGRTRITVSTAGIPHNIVKLAESGLRVKLALSLHSCFEDIRSKIMPINKKYSLRENIDALKYYAKQTKTKIMFEYTMLNGINDTDKDIKALKNLCSQLPSKVNIIPFNSIAHMVDGGFSGDLEPTPMERVREFAEKIMNSNTFVMLRNTQGNDIAAACGQLAVKNTSPNV